VEKVVLSTLFTHREISMRHYTSVKRCAKRAQVLTKAQFKHVLRVTELSRDPERNKLLLCMTHSLGLRVTELAQVSVRDVLYASGRIQEELRIRGETAKFGKPRSVPISSKPLMAALDAYLDLRVAKGIGIVPGQAEFRGLAADLPLIRSGRGAGFSLSAKRRVLSDGRHEEYKAADPLSNTIDRLYARAGFPAASSHSGRRSLASWLLADGVDIEQIAMILGHADVEYTAIYAEPSIDAICKAFEAAL
jgi:integrase/recombinase XerD